MEKGSKSALSSRSSVVSALVLVTTFIGGCSSSNSKPATQPEASTARPAAVLPDTLPDLPPPPPIRELPVSSPRAVKVLSEGAEGKTQPSLIEASRMAKAKKQNDGPGRPAIAITDENLKDFSAGGQVFVLETGTPEDATVPEGAVPAPEAAVAEPVTEAPVPGKIEGREGSESDRELFWRQSVSELRTGLRRSLDDLRRIELESTLLRQQFYSESDPFVRDSEVKPRWDRALDQLNALRKKAKADHEALTALLAEAKKAGVAPDWLRDGSGAELTEEDLRLINGTPPTKQ